MQTMIPPSRATTMWVLTTFRRTITVMMGSRPDSQCQEGLSSVSGSTKRGSSSKCSVLSSKYVEDADYIRINHIGVNYNVPIKLKWLKELNVGVAVKNLAVMTKYSGWNPDVNSFGVNSLSNGFDYGSYPMSKSFVLGVTAKF